MSRDDLNDIPSFTANRDEAVSSAPRGAIPARAPRAEAAMGLTARLVLTIALAVAGIACGWAWQLQTALDDAQRQQKLTQGRVADLEALLSDTDETVNKSAAAMGAQLRLLDTEVRKLWDARKASNGKLTKLEKTAVTQEKQITSLNNQTSTQSEQLSSMQSELAALSSALTALTRVSGDLERLAESAQRAQTDVERLADGLNKSNLERSALRKQVESNAEWIESINAFRRQVNANIAELEADVAALSAPAMQ